MGHQGAMMKMVQKLTSTAAARRAQQNTGGRSGGPSRHARLLVGFLMGALPHRRHTGKHMFSRPRDGTPLRRRHPGSCLIWRRREGTPLRRHHQGNCQFRPRHLREGAPPHARPRVSCCRLLACCAGYASARRRRRQPTSHQHRAPPRQVQVLFVNTPVDHSAQGCSSTIQPSLPRSVSLMLI